MDWECMIYLLPLASYPLYRYKFCLNCDLQLSYLSLNRTETLGLQVMYRVTFGANHCSAELRCTNSDIWNCSPWLDMHHESIDLVSNDRIKIRDNCKGVKAAVLLVALGPGCVVCCVMKKVASFSWD